MLEGFLASEEHVTRTRVPLFVPPGHFYSPICDPDEAAAHLAAVEAAGVPATLPGLRIDRDAMVRTWHALLPFLTDAPFGETPGAGLHYGFDNGAYAGGDGSVLHAMLRLQRPRRVIEIGSGCSSACTLDTLDRYLPGGCDLTCIEPYPALLGTLLGDAIGRVTVIKAPVQSVPLETLDALGAGDILFIDSTHVLGTGSDVCHELFAVLPRLASGVLVHLHDMFWPFEYPTDWAVQENRSWNELQAVRAFLIGNADWDVVFFTDYMARLERPLLAATCPRVLRNRSDALWWRR